MADEAGPFDVILLDAFSSDAIPVHLVTLEAIEAYRAKLSPHGLMILHISNRYIDLRPVVTAIADAAGLKTLLRDQTLAELDPQQIADGATASTVMVIARTEADFGALKVDPHWKESRHEPGTRSWTDDYSNILAALRQGYGR